LQGVELVRQLGGIAEDGRASALGASLTQAQTVSDSLARFPWNRLDPLRDSEDPEARQILDRLSTALASDEIVARAADALQRAEHEAFDFFVQPGPPRPPVTVPPGPTDDPDDVPVVPPSLPPVRDPSVHRVT